MSTKKLVGAFYTVVLITALAGSTAAAAHWLNVKWGLALGPVAAVELGGVVLSAFATERRKLGESAIVARALSAAVAGMAVAVNVFGHDHVGQAAFFGGMSALGYAVYLLMSAAKRRDALRTARKLEDTAPPYGAWQWIRYPGLTRRARTLAVTRKLGKLASLDAARQQVRAERREAGLARAVRKLIAVGAGREMAAIAVDTYDMDQIARRLAERADYDGITTLLAGRLTAEKLAGSSASAGDPAGPADDLAAIVDVTAPTPVEIVEQVVDRRLAELPSPQASAPIRAGKLGRISERASRRLAARKSQPITVVVEASRPSRATGETPKKSTPRTSTGRPSAAEKVARAARALPAGSLADIAKKAGVHPDTAKKHLTAVNGSPID